MSLYNKRISIVTITSTWLNGYTDIISFFFRGEMFIDQYDVFVSHLLNIFFGILGCVFTKSVLCNSSRAPENPPAYISYGNLFNVNLGNRLFLNNSSVLLSVSGA